MAKRSKGMVDNTRPKFQRSSMHTEVKYTTSLGVTVICNPVAAEYERARQGVTLPAESDKPGWIKTSVSGAEEKIPYTDETIEGATDEEKAEYEAWQVRFAEAMNRLAERQLRFIAVRGITLVDPIPEEEWIAEVKFYDPDAEIPEDVLGRLHYYVVHYVLSTEEDGANVLLGIFRASGMDEEVLSQIEASFRSDVGDGEESKDVSGSEVSVSA